MNKGFLSAGRALAIQSLLVSRVGFVPRLALLNFASRVQTPSHSFPLSSLLSDCSRSAAPTTALGGLGCALAELGRATLDLVAFITDADARLVIGQVIDTAIDVFIDDCARLQEGLFDVHGRLS